MVHILFFYGVVQRISHAFAKMILNDPDMNGLGGGNDRDGTRPGILKGSCSESPGAESDEEDDAIDNNDEKDDTKQASGT